MYQMLKNTLIRVSYIYFKNNNNNNNNNKLL